ncbi:N-acetyltransferase [Shimia sp.]|uniref:GNAT family N-acetyltransferase n=1 Tax=Shimia sp. TaxID=1954381 RepID=UPI0032972AA1
MTPQGLADLHAAAFVDTRAWSAREIRDLLTSPLVFAVTRPQGFALGRCVADECELLTLAVHPDARRGGIGRDLLDAFEAESQARGATRAFLEVAQDNLSAISLYDSRGYQTGGQRPDYYTRSDGTHVAARLMFKPLTQGQ